jgi:predicted nucleic acid-binding protein
MPGGPVVLNNTPLAALWAIGRLDLLKDLFGEVLIPEAVRREFLARDPGDRARTLEDASWIRCAAVSQPKRVLAFAGLDRGEAEVLALAEELESRLIVLDEKKARRYAERLGLRKTGTLGILLLAKERGLINSLQPWLERLRRAGLHVTDDLILDVLEIAGEIP